MIKYFCDFCKGETTKQECHTMDAGDTLCKDCYDHLKKQTWRLAESPRDYELAKKCLAEEAEKFRKEKEDWEQNHSFDFKMAARYKNGMYTAIRCYNNVVNYLDRCVPLKAHMFGTPRDRFKEIDIDAVVKCEDLAVDQVTREVIRQNFEDNFHSYIDVNTDNIFSVDFTSLPFDKNVNSHFPL